MAGCQSLALSSTDGVSIIGDPLEKAVLKGCRWTLKENATVEPLDPPKKATGIGSKKLSDANKPASSLAVCHRFGFESRLKRMTVLARESGSPNILVLSKGAPETMKSLLSPDSLPTNFDCVYRYRMSKGQRVLCLGYMDLGRADLGETRDKGRNFIERGLSFCGFIVLDCPLKSDSSRIINELKSSGHFTAMITGDAALTAAEVARQVGIIDTSPRDTFDLREMKRMKNTNSAGDDETLDDGIDEETVFAFVPIAAVAGEYKAADCIAFVPGNVPVLMKMVATSELALCISGEVLTKVAIAAVERTRRMRQKQFAQEGRFVHFPPTMTSPQQL